LDFPARLAYSYGKGRTLTLPWTPGRAYREVGLGAIGGVLADAARELLGENLEVETDLPSQVEIIIGESAAGVILHLRNLSGLRNQSFGDPVAITAGHRLSLRHHSAARVRALVAGVELEVERAADSDWGITIALPRIDLFEVITLDMG
jgi:hypothetical protein